MSAKTSTSLRTSAIDSSESALKQRTLASSSPSSSKHQSQHARTTVKAKKQDSSRALHLIELRLTSLIIGIIVALNYIPATQPWASKFIFSTNNDPTTNTTRISRYDAFIVVFAIVGLTFIRAFLVEFGLKPLAILLNFKTRKSIFRFIEQSWAFIYYLSTFTFGMYLYYHSDYFLSATDLWKGWPHYKLPLAMKYYYLIQLGGWFQQIYVIHVEDRRKDHYQMFAHHIITCFLVIGSYNFHYTRVGHVFQLIMDEGDVHLATAKILNYLGLNTLCDITFVFFTINWFMTRHVLYNYVVWSAIKAVGYLPEKCFYDDASGELVKCFNANMHWFLVILLCFLQIITMAWFYMIIRIIVRVVRGTASAQDTRSDDEEDEEDEAEVQKKTN